MHHQHTHTFPVLPMHGTDAGATPDEPTTPILLPAPLPHRTCSRACRILALKAKCPCKVNPRSRPTHHRFTTVPVQTCDVRRITPVCRSLTPDPMLLAVPQRRFSRPTTLGQVVGCQVPTRYLQPCPQSNRANAASKPNSQHNRQPPDQAHPQTNSAYQPTRHPQR